MGDRWIEQDDRILTFQQGAAFIIDDGRQRGRAADELLRGTPLFYRELIQGQKLSPADLYTVIANSHQLAQPDAPFSIGRQLLPGHDPVLSQLLSQAPTLGDSLHHFITHQHNWLPLTDIQMVETPARLRLYFHDRFNLFNHRNVALWLWLINYSVMALVSFYQWQLNQSLPWTLALPGKAPKHLLAFQQNLGFVPAFKAHCTSLAIPSAMLSCPLTQRSESLYQSALIHASERAVSPSSLIDRVRQELRVNLQQPPKLSEVAQQFQISPATLKRKLKKHRTSYQHLVDECRLYKAVELMEDRHYSSADVAAYFDIPDRSNFRRSWKRWFAQVPT
ncbi:helix-turn-helix domain-containing protein [Reinekea blandensis]|uniref:Transcriptional regulator, AraC family protein n=1 Tax=Reinekea blandensis MED297 TaxID=314283 RepID=A4BD27_9GAMM|nr:AraC family transcriptional regulator [Reinekea blandensis]EAR10109.1 transcriptional regulator, AraC family protein [Reinekea sp. MED297] [Reinekea blandensis MED297]